MSEYKKGDRVKVTVEGVVSYADSMSIDIGSADEPRTYVATVRTDRIESTVEKPPDPLPTTPGSVIRHSGCFLVLSTAGKWGCPDHGNYDGRRAPLLLDGDAVIFDAGKASS